MNESKKETKEQILEEIERLGERVLSEDWGDGYNRVANALTEMAVSVNDAILAPNGMPGKSIHEISTGRAFKMLRRLGMPSKEAEIRSGFGDAESNLEYRDLAPGEEFQVPTVTPEANVSEYDEAKAYTVLMRWLSEGHRPFWDSTVDGVRVTVQPRMSDPTVFHVGWYDGNGKLINQVEFDLRFSRRRWAL
jgi:hypothetical protein